VTKNGYCNFYKVFVLGKKMAHNQQLLKKKILKFDDLETRFKHVEKI
jgi:hypothetical protein